MGKQNNFEHFLTTEGEGHYRAIKTHASTLGVWHDAFDFECKMLANSLALYFDAARTCNETGTSITIGKQGYQQVSPDYLVMKTEYANILKHSPKFGLNPADLSRLFKDTTLPKPKPQPFETGLKLAR